MRVRVFAAAAVSVLVGAVGPSAHAAESASPPEWARNLCKGIDDWRASIEESASDLRFAAIRVDDPAASKELVVKLLNRAEKHTKRLIKKLRTVGAPKVADGDQVQAEVIDGFIAARDVLHDQRVALEAAQPTSEAELAAIVESARTALSIAIGEIVTNFESVSEFDADALNRALDDERACTQLVGS